MTETIQPTIRNDTVTEINDRILKFERMTGGTRMYETTDFVYAEEEETDQTAVPLRAHNPSSLPPAKLELKIGAPIILFRNAFF